MSNWTMDGTIEEATESRSGFGQTLYGALVVRTGDGAFEEVRKVIAASDIAERLQPGETGRFFFCKAADQTALHGIQTPDGERLHSFPMFQIWLFLIILIISGPIFLLNWSNEGLGSLYTLAPLLAVVIALVMLPLLLLAKSRASDYFNGDPGYGADEA